MTTTAVRSATGRRLLLLVLLAVASTALFAVGPGHAQALCGGHAAEYGNWVNADPNARGIARIELRDCQAVTVCDGDICQIQYDAGWIMHTYGKCSPSNCDWGWTSGQRRLSSGQIPGTYDQGYAKRYVYAQDVPVPARPAVGLLANGLRRPPTARTTTLQEWFVRAP